MTAERPTRVWLLRHTQTDWNRERRFQGRSDRPLTPGGRRHAERLARRLGAARFAAIVSSGLTRCDTLGEAAARRRGGRLLRDPRWREVDHGDWEGLTFAEVEARYGAAARERWADPWASRSHGGESLAELWARLEPAWGELAARHRGARVLVVTHAGPIQLLLCAALGAPLHHHGRVAVGLGALTRLDAFADSVRVRAVNERLHRR